MTGPYYTSYFLLNLGEVLTDSSLLYQLYDVTNTAVGSQQAVTGLTDFGAYNYLWVVQLERTQIGVIKFYRAGAPTGIVAESLVTPENILTPTRLAPD